MKREIEIEILTAKEAIDFVKRRPSAIKMVTGQYLLSFFGFERSRVLRTAYNPVRFVDDLLDGDAQGIVDPLAYAQDLIHRIATNSLTNSRIDRQLRYSLDVLESKAKPKDNPRRDFVKAIDAIIFDRERASQRRALPAEEIEQYYHNAFDPVMNITLLAIDSNLRSGDIPVLSFGQGRVYSVRDFEVDWRRGIINVPKEVISSVGLSSHSSLEDVRENTGIADWFHQSLASTKPDLLAGQLLLRQSGEKQTQVVCNSLISPMLKYIEAH
ncbi:MAG: hypothetical protein V1810_04800 [Candidatus Beckwithbacteria bacterium]